MVRVESLLSHQILLTAGDIRAFPQYPHVLYYRAPGCHLCCSTITVELFLLFTCTAVAKLALLEQNWKQERLPCTTWSMRVRFGLHSGVNGNQGACVSSVLNPHTGLQQCPTCSNLGDVGMQCPTSHPACCPDGGCVQNATQCTCNGNHDCPQGTCCDGNRRASVVPPNPADSGSYSCPSPVPTCIVLSGGEGMPSMLLEHDCLTTHMHYYGATGGLGTEL
jgi:hypothetical protein